MRLQLEDASTKIDPELSEGLQDGLQHLESYVDQCLLIARAERNQLSTETEPIDLVSLVEDIIEPFTLLAREEGRELVCDYGQGGQVIAVPWIIRQILHNFLSNALKHGTGTIAAAITHDAGETFLSVSNACKASRTPGTGLGLRIVDALTRCQSHLRHEYQREAEHYRASLVFESLS
jgi:signal transduction histidine kinase